MHRPRTCGAFSCYAVRMIPLHGEIGNKGTPRIHERASIASAYSARSQNKGRGSLLTILKFFNDKVDGVIRVDRLLFYSYRTVCGFSDTPCQHKIVDPGVLFLQFSFYLPLRLPLTVSPFLRNRYASRLVLNSSLFPFSVIFNCKIFSFVLVIFCKLVADSFR